MCIVHELAKFFGKILLFCQTKMVEDIVDEELRAAVKKQQRKKKKEKVKRGPRLSGGRTEL